MTARGVPPFTKRSWLVHTLRAGLLCAAVLVAQLNVSVPARAEEGPAVEVPEGRPCLNAPALKTQIRSWLGNTRIDSSVRIFADEAADGASEARFEVRQGPRTLAQRRFSPAPPDCTQRQAVMALAIALVLEASLIEQLSLAATEVKARTKPARLTLAALLTHSVDVLPESAWGAALELGWAREGWFGLRARLEGSGHPSVDLRGVDGGFSAGLFALGVDGCAHTARSGRLAGALCAGLAGGLLSVRGRGLERSYAGRDAWVAAVGSLVGDVHITPLIALQARVALQLLLTPIQVEARDAAGGLTSQRSLGTTGLVLGLGPAFVFR